MKVNPVEIEDTDKTFTTTEVGVNLKFDKIDDNYDLVKQYFTEYSNLTSITIAAVGDPDLVLIGEYDVDKIIAAWNKFQDEIIKARVQPSTKPTKKVGRGRPRKAK